MKKGSNSYYCAHGDKVNGPEWDGKQEPRLLSKAPLLATADTAGANKSAAGPGVETVCVHDYAWVDEKKFIRVYVDFTDAAAVVDERVVVSSTEHSVEFAVSSTLARPQPRAGSRWCVHWGERGTQRQHG